MNLKEKLYEIDSSQLSKQKPIKRPPAKDIDFYIKGENRETPYGSCYVIQKKYPRDPASDHASIFSLLTKGSNLLVLIGKDLKLQQMNISRTLFLDTETTGLAGGSGTYIFLIGLGYFTEDSFIIEQFFMRNYHEEMAMLFCLNEKLANFDGFITFNGKCYDVPLIKTRFALAKLPTDNFPELHLDLLFTARRLWRNVLEQFNLSNLERFILKVNRRSDVPSYLIPHLFFDYLKTREAVHLTSIFDHNLQDILSLALLTVAATDMFEATHTKPLAHREYLNISKVYEDLKMYERSVTTYKQARTKKTSNNNSMDIDLKLALCYKRLGEWKKAEEIWRSMIEKGTSLLFPYSELAKYYEHTTKDFVTALQCVNKALHKLELQELINPHASNADDRQALLHRKRRLLHKLAR